MNELTEEGYKIEVLKARISRLVSNYEEEIANYQVALQRAQQEIDRLKVSVTQEEAGGPENEA